MLELVTVKEEEEEEEEEGEDNPIILLNYNKLCSKCCQLNHLLPLEIRHQSSAIKYNFKH